MTTRTVVVVAINVIYLQSASTDVVVSLLDSLAYLDLLDINYLNRESSIVIL